MNILLLTTLYPEYENQSIAETSYALHDFAKEWVKDHNVIVVRPIFPKYKRFILQGRLYSDISPDFILNNVHVYNVKIWKLPKFNIFILNNFIEMFDHLHFIPEKILSHMSSSYIIGDNLARYYKCEHIIGIHSSDLKHIMKKSIKNILLRSSLIACRSQSIRNIFLKYYSQYNNKVFIANSGINHSDIEGHDYFLNKIQLWENKKTVYFFTASLLQSGKNIDINLDALSNIKSYNWKYQIAGHGEELDSLQRKVLDLNIADKVIFLGEKTREEVLSYMKESDVFIMVSAPETFGLAYLEAMAKGNIVIGCKNWGIAGIVIDGKNGFLVEERNVNQLECIINNILDMPFENKRKILLETEITIKLNTTEISARKYANAIKGNQSY
jgi:glycosyltransferase involved in cell wall biosynthesis